MLHPALQAFYDANGARFPDLKITREDDRLSLEWAEDEEFNDEIVAYMLSADDADPSFECDDDSAVCEPDHFASAVEAFAWRLLDSDEFKDVLSTASDPNAEPGTFGAIVWTKAIDLHLSEMVETAGRLRAERARLNPTTISDLPLFARDGAPVDADDCDPHGPSVQCHACAAEE
jgi:hypothetical protein